MSSPFSWCFGFNTAVCGDRAQQSAARGEEGGARAPAELSLKWELVMTSSVLKEFSLKEIVHVEMSLKFWKHI